MNLLAIDTSSEYLSIAVLKDGKIAGSIHKRCAMSHSSLLVPTIDKVLRMAKLKPGRIDCFAISVGPGSFTGLRIGVTTIKVLAYCLKKPIVRVPTLDVIARNAEKHIGVICPVLDARKNKVYACFYRSDGARIRKISKYLLLPMAELQEKVRKFKEKVLYLGDMVSSKNWHPKAEIVARLGLEEFKKRNFVRAEDLEPLYLYSKECDIKGI